MTEEAQVQDPNAADMADFVSKYGTEGALEGLRETDSEATPPKDKTPPPSAFPEDDGDGDGDDDGLDVATLQALGLAPKDEKKVSSEDDDDAEEDGTGSSAIDLASLAKTLGLDADDIAIDSGQLKLKTKVDGAEATVSAAELRKGYQLQKHFTKQNEEFLQQKQAWEQARQQQEARVQQLAQTATQVLDAEETALNQQYTRNWDEIRKDDPAEYAAQVADYNQKLNTIRQRKAGLVQNLQQRQQEAMQKRQEQVVKVRQKGRQVLSDRLDWKTDQDFQEKGGRLKEYMIGKLGFNSQEIDNIIDPRPFLIAEKARKYDEVMSKADVARKKIVAAKKTPTGSAPKPSGGKRKRLDTAKARLAKTGSLDDAAAVFANMKGLV